MNNKKWIGIIFSAVVVIALTGCDGISGTGGPSRGTDGDQPGKQTPGNGQAVLGPIVGATVTIRDIEDINTTACSTTTIDDGDIAKAGAINFSAPCIFADHLYVITVTGGSDIDYDDDGVRDATPTPNTGEFRALLGGDQLLQNNWKTNALTESVYQAMQYATQTGTTDIVTTIDNIARQLIRQDLNGDGSIDHRDIALWHPVANADAAKNDDKLRLSTELIHRDLNRTLTEIPDAESLAGHIDTLAPARQVLTHGGNLLVTTDTALLVYRYENGAATLLSSIAPGWIYDMATLGDTLYVALGENGIAQIDISDNANPRIVQRWPTPAERITTLNDHIVFSYVTANNQDALAEITGTSTTTITTSDFPTWPLSIASDIRKRSSDESARGGLLKAVGDTIYWSPSSSLQRFIFKDNQWQKLDSLLDSIPYFHLLIVDDVETFNNTLYIVYRHPWDTLELAGAMSLPAFLQAPKNKQFDMLLSQLVRRVGLINISDPANPVTLNTYAQDDIAAIRRWDSDVVALGTQDISIRYATDLRSKYSLRLPQTFSGFYPSKGIARIDDTLVVAAKENGVLLLTTTNIPVKKYYGKALSEGAIANARVVVTSLMTNAAPCELQSDAEGTIAIPEACIPDPLLYEVAVSGGEQSVGGEWRPFPGTLHADLYAETIMKSEWLVTPLTEIAWRLSQKSAAQDVYSVGVAEFALASWWLTDDGKDVAVTDEIAKWNPLTAKARLKLSSTQWQLMTEAAVTGTWANDTVARLMAPYSGFFSVGTGVDNIAATAHLVFVAYADDLAIFSHDSSIQWLQHLPGEAGLLFAQEDTVTVIDRLYNGVRVYRTEDENHFAKIHEIADPVINYDSAFCAAGERLFGITNFNGATSLFSTVTAWTVTNTGLAKIGSLQISSRDINKLNCSADVLVISDRSHADIVKLTSNRLTLTDGTRPPNIAFTIQDVFFDGTRLYFVGIDDEDSLSRRYGYALDNNGHLTQAYNVSLPWQQENHIAGYVNVGDTKYLVTWWQDLTFINPTTGQDVTVLSLPAGRLEGVTAAQQNVWTWGNGGMLTIDAGKVLAQ